MVEWNDVLTTYVMCSCVSICWISILFIFLLSHICILIVSISCKTRISFLQKNEKKIQVRAALPATRVRIQRLRLRGSFGCAGTLEATPGARRPRWTSPRPWKFYINSVQQSDMGFMQNYLSDIGFMQCVLKCSNFLGSEFRLVNSKSAVVVLYRGVTMCGLY